jgi:hypothetical protein
MDWRCGSSGREPALQAQSPKFTPQFHKTIIIIIITTTTIIMMIIIIIEKQFLSGSLLEGFT